MTSCNRWYETQIDEQRTPYRVGKLMQRYVAPSIDDAVQNTHAELRSVRGAFEDLRADGMRAELLKRICRIDWQRRSSELARLPPAAARPPSPPPPLQSKVRCALALLCCVLFLFHCLTMSTVSISVNR